jgi:hypothetical protein
MEPDVTSHCSQEPSTGPNPIHTLPRHFFKIPFNIILHYTRHPSGIFSPGFPSNILYLSFYKSKEFLRSCIHIESFKNRTLITTVTTKPG